MRVENIMTRSKMIPVSTMQASETSTGDAEKRRSIRRSAQEQKSRLELNLPVHRFGRLLWHETKRILI